MRSTHEEGNENSRVHHHQRKDGGPAVSKTIGNGTGQEDADKRTTLTGLEERTLPFSGNDPTIAYLDTIGLLEGSQGYEVTVQEHIEGFHDLLCVRYI